MSTIGCANYAQDVVMMSINAMSHSTSEISLNQDMVNGYCNSGIIHRSKCSLQN